MFKEKVVNMWCDFTDKLETRRNYIKDKKYIINHLTIDECERLYKSYINKKCVKMERIPNSDNYREVNLTPKEIRRAIYWKLDIDQIKQVVKRVKDLV